MSLQTPTTIRTRQWKLLLQGEDTSRAEVSPRDTGIEQPTIVGLVVKPRGQALAPALHARGWPPQSNEPWPLLQRWGL